MPKRIASLFSGCGGLDLGFTGGFTFRGHEYNRLNLIQLYCLRMILIKMHKPAIMPIHFLQRMGLNAY